MSIDCIIGLQNAIRPVQFFKTYVNILSGLLEISIKQRSPHWRSVLKETVVCGASGF